MRKFISQLLKDGFEPKVNKRYSPNDNWMGVSLYQPYEEIRKGDKVLILDISEVRHNKKSIILKKADQIFYENHNGVLPETEILKEWLS